MKKKFSLFLLALASIMPSFAAEEVVRLQFNRTGTNAESVAVSVVDGAGNAISGATATLAVSHNLKGTSNAVTAAIVCPDVNGNTSPTIELTFQVNGLPAGFAFNNIGLDIHAFNGGSNYQENADYVVRQWNVEAAAGGVNFGKLADIDIAASVGTSGNVHKVWDITAQEATTAGGALTLKLTITKGSQNMGCFFGLSSVTLSTVSAETTDPTPEPEPEPEPTPDPTPDTEAELAGKVYYIQWKNTGTNHITENRGGSLTIAAKNTGKAQFWEFIPTGKTDCYYIKSVATGRYIGSCNLNPSSASRVATSTTPVEYYVGTTAATSGENAGCRYFSSTDCANYSNESAGPRALNKDGASDYIITWTAGVNNVGSYWKLVETTDTYVKPEPVQHTTVAKAINLYFNPCGMEGSIYLTAAKVCGEGALDHIVYEAKSKPKSWHVPYPHDYGQVVRGAAFDISLTLSAAANSELKANAYFDWNADGVFEATAPIALNGTAGTASVIVPEDAANGPMRMRIRINSNGLDLAEDDVEGFVYDFHITATDAQEGRTASVSVNALDRGTATLSDKAGSYAYGTTLTAKATPRGNATFVCWREEGVVVSTDAEYTFTVDRNVKLKAYFTANTDPNDNVETSISNVEQQVNICVQGTNLVATSTCEVHSLSLYTIDAALVAQGCGNTLSVAGVAQGTYIVRAATASGYKNVKIYLNK